MNRRVFVRHLTLRALLVCAMALIGVWPTLPTAAQAEDTIVVTPSVNPTSGELETVEYTVTLTLTGNSSLCPPTVVNRPADILLVLDHSASMYESATGGTETKMDLLKPAAKAFVQSVDLTRDLIGVVQFDSTSNVVQSLTGDVPSLERAIDSLEEGSGTSIDQGIISAMREFATNRGRQDTSKIIVLLSDGMPDIFSSSSAVLQAAEDAKRQGIRIISIALGNNADQDLLRQIAAQPSDFHFAPDASELQQIYSTIASQIVRPTAAANLIVRHTIDSSAIELIPDSLQPQATINGSELVWNLSELLDQPITLQYRARPRAAGTFTIDRETRVEYLRCTSEPRSLDLDPSLQVIAQPPPTPTPVPSPTPSPTPPATLTPAPTPLPTPTPTLPQRVQQSVTGFFCDTQWWMILLWILALLLTLLFLWKLFGELVTPKQDSSPCHWLPWFFLPLSLILLTFLIPIFAGTACAGRESVYFWRIPSGQNNGRIFVTDTNGVREAQELHVARDAGCIGCHAVSSSNFQIATINGGGTGNVMAYQLDGTPIELPRVLGSYAAWSPDGKQLAISTDQQQIVIVDVANQTVTPLEGANDPNVAQIMPVWSPDGKTIAFVRGPRSSASWLLDAPCDIYIVPAAGGTPQPLQGASGDGFNYYPAFSPDGRWLAFTRHVSGTTTYAAPEAEIFLVPSVGGERLRLRANDAQDGSPLTNASNSWPSWSRTGEHLAFTSKRNDPAYDLFVTSIDVNGNSGPAQPLPGAAQQGAFEHLPFWGVSPPVDPLPALLGLWWCLIPFLLVLLAWLLCRRLHKRQPIVPPAVPPRPEPGPLAAVQQLALWQVAPALIVGVGGTGRWVLTHLKKSLRDSGGGTLPAGVHFLLLDTAQIEQTNVLRDGLGNPIGVEFAGVSLAPEEILLMNQSLADVIDQASKEADQASKEADQALARWFPAEKYRGLTPQAKILANGTNGRRPMARAGLISRLRAGTQPASAPAGSAETQDALRLWQALVQKSRDVQEKDGQLVRIIVVGSLAGGMSGALFDVAYLARRAALTVVPEDYAHLEGFFTTPNTFRTMDDNFARLQVNAMASARELQRFQLMRGVPVPFDYRADASAAPSDHSYLAQSSTWPLFDQVLLFGGDGNPERGTGKSDQPWATTLASMADVITFRLERSSARVRAQSRAGLLNNIAAREHSSNQAVVATAGSFVYRLPLVDILDIIRARWAFKLLNVFLGGGTGDKLFAEPDAELKDAAERAAEKFVMGEHEAGIAPRGLRAAGYLANGLRLSARDVLELADGEGRPFDDYLRHALYLILNGPGGSSPDDEQRRAARLALALAFTQAVQTRLANTHKQAEQQRALAPASSARGWWHRLWILLGGGTANQEDWRHASDRVGVWLQIVSRSTESFESLKRLFFGAQLPGEPRVIGLYEELETRQARADARRAQMDQVAVRRYLWSLPIDPNKSSNEQLDLVEKWYPEAEQRLEQYLGRFYWSMAPNGSIELHVYNREHTRETIRPDTEGAVQRLADAIGQLAVHASVDLAQRLQQGSPQNIHKLAVEIKDVLPSEIPQDESDPDLRFIERTWSIALPHMDPARDPQGDVDGESDATVGLPQNVLSDQQYQRMLQLVQSLGTPSSRMNPQLAPTRTSVITSTDQTGVILVREHRLMPLMRILEVQDILKTYLRNAGSQVDRLLEPAIETTVFRAERVALEYERRLEDPRVVNQDIRQLHPLVVSALERPALAELYLLALAAGWVEVEQTARDGETRTLLVVPGQPASDLRLAGFTELSPLVAALLRIAAGRPEDVGLVQVLRASLENPAPATIEAWRRFVLSYQPREAGPVGPPKRFCVKGHEMSPEAKRCGVCGDLPAPVAAQPPAEPWSSPFEDQPQEVRDLGVVAALAAYRRLAPQEWDSLVMQRPRQHS